MGPKQIWQSGPHSMDRGAIDGNWLKANWDAALEPNRGKMGGGLVVWDQTGDLIIVATWSKNFITYLLHAEAVALEREIALCTELGLRGYI